MQLVREFASAATFIIPVGMFIGWVLGEFAVWLIR